MKDVVTKFEDFGECEVDVSKVCEQWNDDCGISESFENFKLFHHNPESDNFTKTDFKVEISAKQANEIIDRLKLVFTESPVFNCAGIWRTTYGER